MPGRSWRAGKAIAAMESPQALIAPLERGSGGFNKASSDAGPGSGICGSKYVEDAKAARSVRVWDRVPIKQQDMRLGKVKQGFPFPSAFTIFPAWRRLIWDAPLKRKTRFSFSLGFHYICNKN